MKYRLTVLEELAGNLPERNEGGTVKGCSQGLETYSEDIMEASSAYSDFLLFVPNEESMLYKKLKSHFSSSFIQRDPTQSYFVL